MCRFELRGDCRDPSCSGQHRRQYLQSVSELCAELRAYTQLPWRHAAAPKAGEAGEAGGEAGEAGGEAGEAGEAGALPPAVDEEEERAQEAARDAAASLRARVPAAPAAAPVVAAASLVALVRVIG